MNLVSGIIDSGFFAQSALSAEVATKDSLGRNISETYLTGIPADYATIDYVDSSVSGKYDTSSFSAISGEFLTALPSDLVYTADLETVSAEITGMIPTALTGDYIETSAIKSAQTGTSAFITGFYDGQLSATYAKTAHYANIAYSAQRAEEAESAYSAHSASYVYSGWGITPAPLFQTTSAIKQYYVPKGYIQGIQTGILYKFNAYSADSASVAASAEKAEKDSLGNIIAMTYLTAHQSLPQSADWNSAASTVSAGYTLWDAAYGTLTANSANWLTAVPVGTMNESNFGYDASNNITAYNGSAFKAGDEFPQSATDAINVVTGGSANWNSTTATVSTNSGAWGGSGIEISAGFGINIQLIDNKLVFSLATATGDI